MRNAQETHTWMEMSVNVCTGLNSIMCLLGIATKNLYQVFYVSF